MAEGDVEDMRGLLNVEARLASQWALAASRCAPLPIPTSPPGCGAFSVVSQFEISLS
jgi:hypothetical protein